MKITWQYIAGLLDGEGCAHVETNNSGRPHMKITIHQANLPFLHLMKNFIGSGKVVPVSEGNWRWQETSRLGSLAFLVNVFPHLVLKKQEVAFVIELLKINPVQGKHLTDEQRLKQDVLASKIREAAKRRREDRTYLKVEVN